MLMPEMETERLIIRSTREADRPDCLSLWLDEEVGRYLADPPREKASEKYLNFAVGIENSTSWYPMVMIHKESGEFLGTQPIFLIYCFQKPAASFTTQSGRTVAPPITITHFFAHSRNQPPYSCSEGAAGAGFGCGARTRDHYRPALHPAPWSGHACAAGICRDVRKS